MGFLLYCFNGCNKGLFGLASLGGCHGQRGLLLRFKLGSGDFVLLNFQGEAVRIPFEFAGRGGKHGNQGGIDPAGDQGK